MKNKYIKEFIKIWKDGDFTVIFIVSIITIIIVKLLPKETTFSVFNNCVF